MKYRRDIDGLRAIAVLPVILFHAGFDWAAGGYVGVDVFFVISGFLITSLILNELNKDQFSLWNFYERRARRILPALFLVCLVSLPFAWFRMLPRQFEAYGGSLYTVAVFASNIWFFDNADYFDPAAEEQPLLHTWSLAVEEQFYLLFPLLLLFIWYRYRPHLFTILSIAALGSLIGAQFGWPDKPAANFYLLPTRAWELLIGALCALAISKLPVKGPSVSDALVSLGLALILSAILLFDTHTPFPSVFTLLPTLGAACVILWGGSAPILGRVLSWPLFVGFGLISYSLYLWHQPLFAFARIQALGEPTDPVFWFLIGASLILAYCSWRWVEQPFRNRQKVSRRALVLTCVPVAIGLFTSGFLIEGSSGVISRVPEAVREVLKYSSDRSPTRKCISIKNRYLQVEEACVHNPDNRKRWAIIGDSHAHAITNQLASSFAGHDVSLTEFTHGGCPPSPELAVLAGDRRCAKFMSDAFEFVLSTPDISTVVLTSWWARYFDRYLNDTELETSETNRGTTKPSTNAIISSIERMLSGGKRLVILYDVPIMDGRVPDLIAHRMINHPTSPLSVSVPYTEHLGKNQTVYNELSKFENRPNVAVFDPAETLCPPSNPRLCQGARNGIPLYMDADHLNHSVGATVIAEDIRKRLSEQDFFQK